MQLRIMLEEVHPPVWRRLLVPGSVRLDKLHRMFQAAMGWEDRHLHSFQVGDALFGTQFDDYPDDELDEKGVTVASAVGEQRRFAYEYDFGDSWRPARVDPGLTFLLGPLAFCFAAILLGDDGA